MARGVCRKLREEKRKKEEEERKKKVEEEKKTEGEHEKNNEEEKEGEKAEVSDFNIPFKSSLTIHTSCVYILGQKSHLPLKSLVLNSLRFFLILSYSKL